MAPGRARLAAKPLPTGLALNATTTGMTVVSCTLKTAGAPLRMTSTLEPDKLSHDFGDVLRAAHHRAIHDCDAATLDPPRFAQSLYKSSRPGAERSVRPQDAIWRLVRRILFGIVNENLKYRRKRFEKYLSIWLFLIDEKLKPIFAATYRCWLPQKNEFIADYCIWRRRTCFELWIFYSSRTLNVPDHSSDWNDDWISRGPTSWQARKTIS